MPPASLARHARQIGGDDAIRYVPSDQASQLPKLHANRLAHSIQHRVEAQVASVAVGARELDRGVGGVAIVREALSSVKDPVDWNDPLGAGIVGDGDVVTIGVVENAAGNLVVDAVVDAVVDTIVGAVDGADLVEVAVDAIVEAVVDLILDLKSEGRIVSILTATPTYHRFFLRGSQSTHVALPVDDTLCTQVIKSANPASRSQISVNVSHTHLPQHNPQTRPSAQIVQHNQHRHHPQAPCRPSQRLQSPPSAS